nr:M48 family metallopeptidase [Pseudomonadales bacterium]
MVGVIEFGRESICYEVQFFASRRTLGIEVHPDQRVVVRAPTGCSTDVIAERVQKRASWISRQIADFQRYNPRTPQRQYLSGETHLHLGRQYRLKVISGDVASVKLSRGYLTVTVSGVPDRERVRTMLHRWNLERAKDVFEEVLIKTLTRSNIAQHPRIIVRAMQSRWGSLSRAGTMTLNSQLIRAPRACIEYVITHELCHLTHRDHDASFYRMLGQLMPDWEKRKQRLEAA